MSVACRTLILASVLGSVGFVVLVALVWLLVLHWKSRRDASEVMIIERPTHTLQDSQDPSIYQVCSCQFLNVYESNFSLASVFTECCVLCADSKLCSIHPCAWDIRFSGTSLYPQPPICQILRPPFRSPNPSTRAHYRFPGTAPTASSTHLAPPIYSVQSATSGRACRLRTTQYSLRVLHES
jgi:hypothetical protein